MQRREGWVVGAQPWLSRRTVGGTPWRAGYRHRCCPPAVREGQLGTQGRGPARRSCLQLFSVPRRNRQLRVRKQSRCWNFEEQGENMKSSHRIRWASWTADLLGSLGNGDAHLRWTVLQSPPPSFMETHLTYKGEPPKWNYLLEGGPLIVQASPTRWVF